MGVKSCTGYKILQLRLCIFALFFAFGLLNVLLKFLNNLILLYQHIRRPFKTSITCFDSK